MPKVRLNQISDYSLIGNCRTAALVSKSGSIDWCCFPKFDSPSYFARLLDPAGGHFSLTPVGYFQSHQNYIDQTNVVQTKFVTETGSAILTDLFSVKHPQVHPNELWPDEEILRILEAEPGEIEFRLEFFPRTQYGQRGIRLSRKSNWGIKGNDGRKHFFLQTSFPMSIIKLQETRTGEVARATFKLNKGDKAIISLSYSDESPAVIPPLQTALERFEHTLSYWRSWSARCPDDGLLKDVLIRSALALKLLNFAPSGAFIAAPTTSLPEWIGGVRNWDYRFCWLRDAAFTTRALLRLGYIEEAKSFLNWLLHSTRLTWPRLQVLYTVYGESKVKESTADWMSGYFNSKPVRIGNRASVQIQLDVYGEVINSLYSLVEYLNPVDQETKKMVIGFGGAVAEFWDQPDHGIWEFRSEPKHYTHSKVMCWVAMDRLTRLAERFKWNLPYNPREIAVDIRNEIESKGFDSNQNSYTRAFGESELDASLLVMPLVGFCEASSLRFQSTRDAIIRRLSRDGLVYRYPPASDGFTEPEGAFVICNFWLAECFAEVGDLPEAQKWFHAVTQHLPSSGLASEEINPETKNFLGNFPQGFSHIGLINAALSIHKLQKMECNREKSFA